MSNVYDRLIEFYNSNSDAKFLFSMKDYERHLRKCAWKNEDESILNLRFEIFSKIILLAIDIDLDSIYDLLPEDYLEIFYQTADFENKKLDENLVLKYIKFVEELFLEREAKGFNGKISEIEFIKNFFYDESKFYLKKREKKASYKNLERLSKLSSKEIVVIQNLKKQWIEKIFEHYNNSVFENDINRASNMFFYDDNIQMDIDKDNFEFKEYFLFDYHLISNDLTPLEDYHSEEKNNLNEISSEIIEEYLKSRFTVFFVVREDDDTFLCKDLFREREFYIPYTSEDFPEYKNMIFTAHIEEGSFANPYYIKGIFTDTKVRETIIKEIKRAKKLFSFQSSNPTFTNFFKRHANTSIKIIFKSKSLHNFFIIPEATDIKYISNDPRIFKIYKEPFSILTNMGKKINLSAYSLNLLQKYYHDFLINSNLSWESKTNNSTLFACLKNYLEINGDENFLSHNEIISFKADVKKISDMRKKINDVLKSEKFDPRYLSEEGFLNLINNK